MIYEQKILKVSCIMECSWGGPIRSNFHEINDGCSNNIVLPLLQLQVFFMADY